ncbi:hypothetical protein [Thomasclavelia cocleata]|uniref:hypothetical protein n=1 Tax=Thomasclavelia cocleata TaxID=69824 RepID=UPI00256EFB1A|nr:hypothetical protein [Thomasclavelia cocleata]
MAINRKEGCLKTKEIYVGQKELEILEISNNKNIVIPEYIKNKDSYEKQPY